MIPFNELQTSNRQPGTRIELNTSNAVRGLPANRRRLLIIGQRLASGAVAALVPTLIASAVEAAAAFGNGSIAARMAMAAIRANRYLEITVIGLADPAGANAVGTITFTGPATAAGSVTLLIGAERLQLAIANAATATDIAAAVAAAITARPDLPVTAAAALGVVTVTFKHKGTIGNKLDLSTTIDAVGTTAVVVPLAGGTLEADLTGALDLVFASSYELYAWQGNIAADVQELRDHLDAKSNGMEMRPGRAIVAIDDTIANAVTLAASVNAGRVALVLARGCASPPWEIAAAAASVECAPLYDDPAIPRREMDLIGLHLPPVASRFSDTEINTLLYSGVTPVDVGPGEVLRLVRLISTHTVNAAAVADWALLDFNTLDQLDYGRKAIRTRLSNVFARAKATSRVVKDIRSEILMVAKKLEEAEIWENVTANAAAIIVERDPNEPTRVNFRCPADVVNGLHQVYGVIDMIL